MFVISLSRPGYEFDLNADPKQWIYSLTHAIGTGELVKDELAKVTDSRNYINLPDCQTYHIRNEGDLPSLRHAVLQALESFNIPR